MAEAALSKLRDDLARCDADGIASLLATLRKEEHSALVDMVDAEIAQQRAGEVLTWAQERRECAEDWIQTQRPDLWPVETPQLRQPEGTTLSVREWRCRKPFMDNIGSCA